jgi:hypothetical protein
VADIVLAHGTTQTAAGFGPLIGILAPAGHRAIRVDVPARVDHCRFHDRPGAGHLLLVPRRRPGHIAGALIAVASRDLSADYAETPGKDPRRVPSTYLLPAEDRILTRTAMEDMARERLGMEPVAIRGDHYCYFAHPGDVAAAIDEAARCT